MNKDWQKTTIGELGHVVTGTTPSPAVPGFYGGDIPFVTPGDLGKSLLVHDTERTLTSAGLEQAKLIPKGAILFTCIGATIGKSAIAARELATNQQINSVICYPNKVDHRFLYYLLNLRTNDIKRLAGHQAVPIVNKSTFENIAIVIPSLPEQRRIAEILRTWDEAIEKIEASRVAKINHQKWLRSNLITGRKRISGFSEEWRLVPLGKVLTEHRLQSTGSEEVYSVSVHKGLVNQVKHLGRPYAARDTGRYNRVLPGDVVYTKSPTGNFPLGIVKQSKVGHAVIVSPLYGVFTPVTCDLGVILDAYFDSPTIIRNFLNPLVQKGPKTL